MTIKIFFSILPTSGYVDMISPFGTESSYLTKVCVVCVALSGFIALVNS